MMTQIRIDCTRRRLALALASALTLAAAPLPSAEAATPTPPADNHATILVMGDSLSAEYGLPRGTGWVALLEQRLQTQHLSAKVVNASISGETTWGGRTRLGALLSELMPTHVVIELGANDALRGLPLKASQDNLQAMIDAGQKAGAKVVLVGMMVPPNYGRRYTEDFRKMYETLARTRRTAFVPFLLRGVADRPDAREWFQADGIHPLPKGHPVMLDNVWAALQPLL
jgi:acyl-CoA thioesterase-1